jgi:hypothetical protein
MRMHFPKLLTCLAVAEQPNGGDAPMAG